MWITMNPTWVGLGLIVPLVAALLVAWPLWIKRVRDEVGTIVGAGIVLVFVVFFIAREFNEIQITSARCLEAEVDCRFYPEPFTRYAIYGSIGMAQVFVLFAIGLKVEERLRMRAGA